MERTERKFRCSDCSCRVWAWLPKYEPTPTRCDRCATASLTTVAAADSASAHACFTASDFTRETAARP